nr:baseplate J/gp47 family protein [uncultured Selenomonas sp.]DAQ55142.1 MAG TPA: Baseplate J like protein [Bacteriophage sp.]
MAIVPFKPPEWLGGMSSRSIQERMMQNLPLDIDKTEGGFVWDLTFPTALEKAELLQFHLIRTLHMMHHMWAEGRWLDYHAHENGLVRKPKNKAYGTITITGQKRTAIPKGFVFSVPSDGGVPAIDFETLDAAVINENGVARIAIQALEGGTKSNVAADTIVIMRSPIKGIIKITNEEPLTGGVEEESDASLRERIDDLLAGNGDSYVGNNADYVRWAKEVPGVGFAYTIPNYNGINSVKVVVVDANGSPANAQIIEAVRVHIFGTDRKDINRLAPVGLVDFLVSAPSPVVVDYKLSVRLNPRTNRDAFIQSFKSALLAYYQEISKDAEEGRRCLKYIMVAAILARLPSVDDFKNFRMNGSMDNILYSEEEYPITGKIEVDVYV